MSAFTRSQGPPVWARVIAVVAAVFCLIGLYGNLVHVVHESLWGGLGGAAISLGGLLLDVAVITTRFTATVTAADLRLSFLPFYRKVVPLEDIAAVGDVRQYTAAECGGVGVRFNGRGRVSLLWAPGEGFPVTTTTGSEYRIILPGASELSERLRHSAERARTA